MKLVWAAERTGLVRDTSTGQKFGQVGSARRAGCGWALVGLRCTVGVKHTRTHDEVQPTRNVEFFHGVMQVEFRTRS